MLSRPCRDMSCRLQSLSGAAVPNKIPFGNCLSRPKHDQIYNAHIFFCSKKLFPNIMLVDLRPILPGMQLQSLDEICTVFIGIIVSPTALSKAGNKHDARTNPDICHCGTRVGRHGAIDVCPPAPNRANTLPRELSDIAPASPLLLAWFQRQLP